MNRFWFFALRNLWVRKTRTLVTLFGILLGVSAMLSVSVMSASTAESLKNFFAQASGRANLTVTESGTSGEGMPERTLSRLRHLEGIVDAVGVSNHRVLLDAKDKQVAMTVMGIDPDSDLRIRSYTLKRGRFFQRREKSQNILLVEKFAANRKIGLGDTITLVLPDGSEDKFAVIGLVADEGAGHLQGGSIGFVNLEVAQRVFDRGSRVDSIDLIVAPEIADSPDRLKAFREQLQTTLGDKFAVTLPSATGESVSQALSSFNAGMGMFGVIALFVGLLLIYNTFAMTIAERTREIGMLRALGATRRQVLLLILSEAAFLGLFGSLFGIGGGLLLSIPLVQVMASMLGIALETFTVPSDGLIHAVGTGLVTTLVAALVPAWQASRIAPTEALRARAGGRESGLMRQAWKMGIVLIALAVLDALGIWRINEGSVFLIYTFLGAILLMPNLIVLVERAGRGGLATLYGPMGELGSRNLVRAKARATLTVGVLMIGVVMTVSIGAMSISFHASMDDWMNAVLGGDFIITSTDPMREDLMREIDKVPGIAGVTPERWLYGNLTGILRRGILENRQDPFLLIGIDPATRRAISTFQFMGGEDLDTAMNELASGDAMFVSTALRDRWNIRRDDMVRLRTTRGEHDFRVVAIVMSFMQSGQSMITSRRDLEKYFGDKRVSMFMANRAPEASSIDVEERLKNGIAKSKRLVIQAGDEFRQSLATQVQQFFLMFDAMVWIAVIVGALGVVNTMTMNVLERVREIGTLRSIGTTRGQVMGMILSEAGALGVLGAFFGVLVALPISREGVTRMAETSGFPMTYIFPPSSFVAGVVIALVVSQLAALYPTWRAVHLNIIEAIKEE